MAAKEKHQGSDPELDAIFDRATRPVDTHPLQLLLDAAAKAADLPPEPEVSIDHMTDEEIAAAIDSGL